MQAGKKRRPLFGGRREIFQSILEEERVERNRFRKRHTDDGLNENAARSAWIAPNCFCCLSPDEANADCGSETAKSTLDAAFDFCEYFNHF